MQPERLALVKPSSDHPTSDTGTTLEPLLTAADVAKVLGVRPKRVYELGIPAVRISERSLRWSRGDVAQWISERKGVA
jgi:predicted DNA-binding transcriptional regulator AlpA